MALISNIAVAVVVGLLGWCYRAIQPPPPKICGSPGGPPVTAKRIRLKDGRHLAYREEGVPKEKAAYRLVVVHAFGDSKDTLIPVSKELVEELGIYFLHYDRAGYGESDPNPGRSVRSEASDVGELIDELGLGERLFLLAASMGGCIAWSCLKYLPHRLAGVAMVSPVTNYWWPSLPAKLSKEGLKHHLLQDQWTIRVAHYAPSLLYWWMTQEWFPHLAGLQGNMDVFSRKDKEVLQKMMESKKGHEPAEGVFESLHRDMMMGFGSWDFEPLEIDNPFLGNDGLVHIWQGGEDRFVPFFLQRYLTARLPWIKYHEIPDAGHLVLQMEGMSDSILRALLVGEEQPGT